MGSSDSLAGASWKACLTQTLTSHGFGHGQPESRSSAFEEVASILIRDGVVEWPDGTLFLRFGNPDGGREGKGELQNGDVWG